MTGLFERFRAWVGSLFGSAPGTESVPEGEQQPETAETATVTDEEVTAAKLEEAIARAEGASTEPPTEPEPPEPDSATTEPTDATAAKLAEAIAQSESTPTTKTIRHEPDATADASESPFQLEGGPKTVRFPSDEEAGDDEAGEEADDVAVAEADDEVGDEADDESDSVSGDFDYRCTVCGTGVETPDAPCPLCHSSEIVPTGDAGDVYDSAGEDEPTSAGASGPVGQKTTAVSDAEDAVERLRNLRGNEE